MTDNRKYLSWKDDGKTSPSSLSYLPLDSGMVFARRALNELHRMLAKDGYGQVCLPLWFKERNTVWTLSRALFHFCFKNIDRTISVSLNKTD